ncbi:unnamed protein product, partial [Cylicocyclus nassatus]
INSYFQNTEEQRGRPQSNWHRTADNRNLHQSSTNQILCAHSLDGQSGAVKMTKIWLLLLISHPVAGKLFVEENAELKESNSDGAYLTNLRKNLGWICGITGMCSLSGPTNHQLPPSELAAPFWPYILSTPPPAIFGPAWPPFPLPTPPPAIFGPAWPFFRFRQRHRQRSLLNQFGPMFLETSN